MFLVSVIIPTYARPQYLRRAIDSVLAQTYPNIEIIVVDDNGIGTENQRYTSILLSEYIQMNKIIYLAHEKNKNGSAARNTGIRHAHGQYIAFLDDDDEFLPTKIEKQVKRLEECDSQVGACYCGWNIMEDRKLRGVMVFKGEGNLLEDMLTLKNPLCGGSSLLLKRQVCEHLNGFDETFRRHQDWEFMVRFFRKYDITVVAESLVVIHIETHHVRPKSKLIEEVKMQFLSKFASDIDLCENSHLIYKKQYIDLSYNYFRSRNIVKGLEFLMLANKYSSLSLFEWLLSLYVYCTSLFKCTF